MYLICTLYDLTKSFKITILRFKLFIVRTKTWNQFIILFSGFHNYLKIVSTLLVHFKFQIHAAMDNVYKICHVLLNEIIV